MSNWLLDGVVVVQVFLSNWLPAACNQLLNKNVETTDYWGNQLLSSNNQLPAVKYQCAPLTLKQCVLRYGGVLGLPVELPEQEHLAAI